MNLKGFQTAHSFILNLIPNYFEFNFFFFSHSSNVMYLTQTIKEISWLHLKIEMCYILG